MYIAYRTSNGKTYTYVVESVRERPSVDKKYLINLGRVLDKDKGIYCNLERGVYTYDIATDSYGKVEADFMEPPKRTHGKYVTVAGKKRSRLCIESDNIFFLDSFLKKDCTKSLMLQDTAIQILSVRWYSIISSAHSQMRMLQTGMSSAMPDACSPMQPYHPSEISESLAGIDLEDATTSGTQMSL